MASGPSHRPHGRNVQGPGGYTAFVPARSTCNERDAMLSAQQNDR